MEKFERKVQFLPSKRLRKHLKALKMFPMSWLENGGWKELGGPEAVLFSGDGARVTDRMMRKRRERRVEKERGDRISELQDPLLQHILYFLPFKQVVQSNTLSKRWKHVSPTNPVLEFDDSFKFKYWCEDSKNTREREKSYTIMWSKIY